MLPGEAEKPLRIWDIERLCRRARSHRVREVSPRRPALSANPRLCKCPWAWMIPFLIAPQLVCLSLGGREVYFISSLYPPGHLALFLAQRSHSIKCNWEDDREGDGDDSWNGIFKCLERLLRRGRAFTCILSFNTETDRRTPSPGVRNTSSLYNVWDGIWKLDLFGMLINIWP